MRKKSFKYYFRSKLVMVQFCLALPIITVLFFLFLSSMERSAAEKFDNIRMSSLSSAVLSFDGAYTDAIKLLQKPYTDQVIYSIITRDYPEEEILQKREDQDLLKGMLRNNFLYYEPNILTVTLVSEITDTVYYAHRPPCKSVNIHNPEWYDYAASQWYQDATAAVEPIVSQATYDELFLNTGLAFSITQRLKDVPNDRLIGAIRMDFSLDTFYKSWTSYAREGSGIFAVLDHEGHLVFASSDEILSQTPLLTTIHLEDWEDYNIVWKTAPVSGFHFFYLTSPSPILLQSGMYIGLPLAIFFIGIIYAMIFIYFSSKSISQPIHTLKQAMLQGQLQDLSVRCPPLPGEMRELSNSFNSLMACSQELVNKVAKKEQEKARLSYEVLQSKVSPHFLYNTLSAIQWKADMAGLKDVAKALGSLSSLLRFTIKCAEDLIPFETELQQLENYLQIMRVRYGDQVEVAFDIDEDCYNCLCPKFLIQPAVENSYLHAFASGTQATPTIQVSVTCQEKTVRVVIEDNGDGMDARQLWKLLHDEEAPRDKDMFISIGISNVRGRLQQMFGSEYDMTAESEPGRFTRITALIPRIQKEDNP